MSFPRAVIFGWSGPELTQTERHLFKESQPFGFILFQRNCITPDQVKHLVQDLRRLVNDEKAPILIDQEGGRVARLKPPYWPLFPHALTLGQLAEQSLEKAVQAAHDQGRLIGHTLAALGINVNCAPVCDLPGPEAHDVIGDRAFGTHVPTVVALAKAFSRGMMIEGILPIMKHIPGHGRATLDSHADLPIVTTSYATLKVSDFQPFKELSPHIPLAMTAHVTYTAIDPDQPATLSPTAIRCIREDIGFDGLLISDDLSMKALDRAAPGKSLMDYAQIALNAGVDVVLHCNGHFDEMSQLTQTPSLTSSAHRRWRKAQDVLAAQASPSLASIASLQKHMANLFPGYFTL